MTSTKTKISFKAHSKCVRENSEPLFKPSVISPIFKKNNSYFKTPYKPKQTQAHRRNVPRVKIEVVNTLKKFSSCQNLNVKQKDCTIAQCNKSKSFECLKDIHKTNNHNPICVTR